MRVAIIEIRKCSYECPYYYSTFYTPEGYDFNCSKKNIPMNHGKGKFPAKCPLKKFEREDKGKKYIKL